MRRLILLLTLAVLALVPVSARQTVTPFTGSAWLGYPPALIAAAPAHGQITLASGVRRIAMIFRVPKSGTLDKFELMTGTITNQPDNGIRFSFQDVDTATGFPDGTQDQYRDVPQPLGVGTWIAPGLMTSDGTDGGNKRVVTRGDLLSVVFEFVTFVVSDDIDWRTNNFHNVGERALAYNVYTATHNGTVWAKGSGSLLTGGLKYADGTYGAVGHAFFPISVHTALTYNSGSAADEAGLYFQMPSTLQVSGAWARLDLDGPADVVLYDVDGLTVLRSVSLASAVRGGVNGMNLHAPFVTPVTLQAGMNYRLVVKPTSVTSLTLYSADVPATGYLDAFDGGLTWYYTSRVDAGGWTQLTTRRPWMGLEISGTVAPASMGAKNVTF